MRETDHWKENPGETGTVAGKGDRFVVHNVRCVFALYIICLRVVIHLYNC